MQWHICILKMMSLSDYSTMKNGMNIGGNDGQILGLGIDIDRKQTLFIADSLNHRIIEVVVG